jgi:hypothetical protein
MIIRTGKPFENVSLVTEHANSGIFIDSRYLIYICLYRDGLVYKY